MVRKIGTFFVLVFLFFLVEKSQAMIGPSVSISGASIFGKNGFTSGGISLKDPQTGNFITSEVAGIRIIEGIRIAVNDPLTWSPPALVQPTVVTIENSATAGYIKITKSVYPYTSPTVTESLATLSQNITIGAGVDAEIWFSCDQVITSARILIQNGRQVNIIGGSLKGNAPADASIRGVLRAAGQSRGVYVEGLILDANFQVGLDGFEFGSTVGIDPFFIGNVTVQNTYVKNLSGAAFYHADCLQPYGATRTVRVDKFKGRGMLQCIFFDPQNDHAGFDMRRIDVDYRDPNADETETGYVYYLHAFAPEALSERRRPPFGIDLNYAGRRETSYGVAEDGWWSYYSIYPPSFAAYGAVLDIPEPNPTMATFPSFPEISGFVVKGNPPEPFVNESQIGLNYISPGYIN